MSFSTLTAGLIAAVAGWFSTFALILQAMRAMGASDAQAAAALMAVTVAMGLGGIALSLVTRMPVSVAWSTPGAALLVATAMPEGGFPVAIGAFVLTGGLIIAASLIPVLARAVAAIPVALAQAMLAGVLLPLCLVPVQALVDVPAYGFPILLAWFLVGRLSRIAAAPAAVAVAAGLIAWRADLSLLAGHPILSTPILVMPEFTTTSLAIALPLFVVTMASQNIPGIAVLRSFDYDPATRPIVTATGGLSILSAPFGAMTTNLAAITAAICASPDAHPDPARRYWSAVWAGGFYILFGNCAAGAVGFAGLAPAIVLGAVAGLALIGALSASAAGALGDPDLREAAIVTFLFAASGVTILGISGAFWGLLAGLAVHGLKRRAG